MQSKVNRLSEDTLSFNGVLTQTYELTLINLLKT